MPTEMRQKFSEIKEEQEIYVHDAIEVMERCYFNKSKTHLHVAE